MSEDPMANDVQAFQDNQWAVPLPHTLPPTKWAEDLAAHLRAAGYIHISETAPAPSPTEIVTPAGEIVRCLPSIDPDDDSWRRA